MARSFDDASSQYLSGSLTQALPLTMACWFYPTRTDANGIVMSLSKAGGTERLYLTWAPTNTRVEAGAINSGGSSGSALYTLTPASYVNTWALLVGRFESTTSRYVSINTSTPAQNITTISAAPDTAVIAARISAGSYGAYFDGYVANAAVWNVSLSTADIVNLYNSGIGADPRSVRPDALVAYWPLVNGDGDQDYWGNAHLTASGSPTYAQHPPALMRSRPKYVVLGAASGAPTISSVTITGTRTVSNTLTANVVTVPSTVDSTAYQWEIADDGSGTNAADLTGETSQTLALTYADFASRLDANGEAYVRVGAIATVGAESSAESFSDWVRVTAGGSGVVRPIGQSVYISV